MKIDDKSVDRIAELSRLEFDAASKEEIKQDLNRILGFIDKLEELDTSNTEPLIFMSEEINVLREDEDKSTITQVEALKNAPRKDSDYFRVPKVLNK
ncbi:MAG: Asp-tRNA(Asn)/Glu-tRNA(Gln) amidotransferase subunit GatC [Flavobacteriales bacterium]|nr:Asp-tRNA(Asn)/Glu-tRNA(Gln) amidotransferase subunit GatC [Flavobacteriales bacterium]